jgi:hypothetical protein
VIRQGRQLYFLYSAYFGGVGTQGVALGRMRLADLENPQGHVRLWTGRRFGAPGLGGIAKPIWQAEGDWHTSAAAAFWGPSVHWNTYLRRYVILLNRSEDPTFAEHGIYIAYAKHLADPRTWSRPRWIFGPGDWYPQVIGTDIRHGTDRRAGRFPRFFDHGFSFYKLRFTRR